MIAVGLVRIANLLDALIWQLVDDCFGAREQGTPPDAPALLERFCRFELDVFGAEAAQVLADDAEDERLRRLALETLRETRPDLDHPRPGTAPRW